MCEAIEVIVVDNASTDGTMEMVRQRFPSVRLISRDKNEGYARSNNVGLAIARGRYLLLLNSDTEVIPGALAEMISFMDAHPAVGACGPMLLNADGSLQPSGRALPTLWSVFLDMSKLYRLWKSDLYRELDRDYTKPTIAGEISGAALFVRRACYEQCGGLDPTFFAYYEDVDWCKRIGDAGWSVAYVPSAQITHLWKRTSRQVSERAYRAGQDSLRYYFYKHHGRTAAWMIQMMLTVKELTHIVASLLRRNSPAALMHWEMLRALYVPLSITE